MASCNDSSVGEDWAQCSITATPIAAHLCEYSFSQPVTKTPLEVWRDENANKSSAITVGRTAVSCGPEERPSFAFHFEARK